MKKLLTLLLISQLTMAQDNSTNVSGLVAEVKQLKIDLAEYRDSQRCYKSGWIKIKENESKELAHDLAVQPSKAFIWVSYFPDGNKATLIDSVYTYRGDKNSMGFGAWLVNVTDQSYKIMAGGGSPSSVQLDTGNGLIIYPKTNYYSYIQIILCK